MEVTRILMHSVYTYVDKKYGDDCIPTLTTTLSRAC
jgi:hypothetical protein